jgi:hypothetical protein
MKWMKNVIVDIFVSGVIVAAVLLKIEWLTIVVIAYTILMLVLKLMAVVSDPFMKSVKTGKAATVEAPLWFISVLYAFNVLVLMAFGWYYTATQWVLIWLFSWIAFKKGRSGKAKSKK